MSAHRATCLNCGNAFESNRPKGTVFQCSGECRREFNNRRATRGAEIYDLMMTLRYDRQAATDDAVWSKACALLASFRADDGTTRGGRRSWQDHNAVIARKPAVYASRVYSTAIKLRQSRKAVHAPAQAI